MDQVVMNRLQSVRFGEAQQHRNITLLPLLAANGAVQYQTLGEALAKSAVAITEVSSTGSVPELLVINRAGSPVLLMDGEELAGAKQNRVLNTTILLREKSETRVPVSCTEQGRWGYVSPSFGETGHVMAHQTRVRKSSSVSQSLKAAAGYHSNQSEVWAGIAHLQALACHHSPTSAMNDVFKSREEDLGRALESFQCRPGQTGLLVLLEGAPAGFDLLSLDSAYARVHPKLVRSYVLEGLLRPQRPPVPAADPNALAQVFLERAAAAEERRFPSVGYGSDCRYQGASIVGSALVHEGEAIHTGFFQLEAPGQSEAEYMASLRNRRRAHRGFGAP
jgi:hypothetical protein